MRFTATNKFTSDKTFSTCSCFSTSQLNYSAPLLSYSVAFVVHNSLGDKSLSKRLHTDVHYPLLSSITVVADFLVTTSKDRASCDGAVLKIISDTTKFKPIEKKPTLLRESQLQRIIEDFQRCIRPVERIQCLLSDL